MFNFVDIGLKKSQNKCNNNWYMYMCVYIHVCVCVYACVRVQLNWYSKNIVFVINWYSKYCFRYNVCK